MVVGADSQIGSAAMLHLRHAGNPVIGTTRRKNQVHDGQLLIDLADAPRNWPPLPNCEVAIVCAAVTGIVTCQMDPEKTRRINVHGTLELIHRLVAAGAYVVFLSSSAVFDGSSPHPRTTDPTTAHTEYGKHKEEVEKGLLVLPDPICIVRPTKVLAPATPLLTGWVKDLRAGRPIHPFFDMVLAPISLMFVTQVLAGIVEKRCTGIVHISAARDITYADAARFIAEKLGCKGSLIEPVSFLSAGHSPENVPAHTALDTSRLSAEFGFAAPDPFFILDSVISPK